MLMMNEEDFSDVHLLPPLKGEENDLRQAKKEANRPGRPGSLFILLMYYT